ncbi:MAG: UDP-2,4-diacetamido-2,4,6-trideoxy-beta-L-altropyranose hydrolase [Gammaproteobacteria bacterium]|nr:UDP-2,4-diacetamido-2,4,6-trideoxy-beta-L-altropyranose hydrolase [Gammaproteobacteria bacterium]
MTAVFRVDFSDTIGIGHLFRCLTLANALHQKGISCVFISRSDDTNSLIAKAGHQLVRLNGKETINTDAEVKHASWLSTGWQQDAEESLGICKKYKSLMLIVDHYALDYKWEKVLTDYCKIIVVLDDLADRKHNCQLLIDSNYLRRADEYRKLLVKDSEVLAGSEYTLLKPDFTVLRAKAEHQRKATDTIKKVLVFLGGGNTENTMASVLSALSQVSWPVQPQITVVLSSLYKHVDQVVDRLSEMVFETKLMIDTPEMARLILNADLAVGASGSSTWERCCLGLPSVNILIANNQQYAHKNLGGAGVIEAVKAEEPLEKAIATSVQVLVSDMKKWHSISERCFSLIDGLGTRRVVSRILSYS